jgi:hypothetical protein
MNLFLQCDEFIKAVKHSGLILNMRRNSDFMIRHIMAFLDFLTVIQSFDSRTTLFNRFIQHVSLAHWQCTALMIERTLVRAPSKIIVDYVNCYILRKYYSK